jgi:RND family efflux transporter MFP subunit
MKRILIIGAGIGVLAGLGLGIWFGALNPGVTVGEARLGRAVEVVYATAVVEPVHWGGVGPVVIGRIASIRVKEGDRVTRGDELARLDDGAARARLRELEALIQQYRADVERLQPLVPRGFASAQSLDHAQSALSQARAALAAARHVLNDLVLRAPLDGVVLRRDGEIGETVGPERTLFWVGKPRPLRAEAEVDEEDIPRVRVGQEALIKADAFPGRVLKGTVLEITPKGDPIAKSYRVRLALPDETPLLIGMTIEANIIVRINEKSVLVPADALALEGTGIWLVRDGRARRADVVLGVKSADTIEVRRGIKAGDQVILLPPAGLRDGDRVRPRHNGSGPPS